MKCLPPTIVIPVMLVVLIVIDAACRPRAVDAPPTTVHGAAGPSAVPDRRLIANA
jgi:hypothetical protein